MARTASASAPRTAPPNEDAFGNRTTYVAANMLDGLPETCWRMAGDGTGTVLTFALASPTTLTRVGMINGYAKNAVVGGRNLNWYLGNRRVLSAEWIFEDGTTVDQPLGETKQMQTLDLGAPVTTSTVQVAPDRGEQSGDGPLGARLHRGQRGHLRRDAGHVDRRPRRPRPPRARPAPRRRAGRRRRSRPGG